MMIGMILTFVLVFVLVFFLTFVLDSEDGWDDFDFRASFDFRAFYASFPFQLRKIGIERNVLLHCKSIILKVLYRVSSAVCYLA
jgi:hypothetical protein